MDFEERAQRPRDIFLAACAEIARGLLPLGYRYLRSKSRIVRREGDLRFEILLASSPRNCIIAKDQRESTAEALVRWGGRNKVKLTAEAIENLLQGVVDLSLRASVHSAQLGNWRRSQPAPLQTDDYVAGNEIGLLRTPPSVEDFNVAPKTTRQQSIVEAAALAHDVALPFFDQFRKPDKLIERLMEKDLPGFWEALTFDYVLCFGGRRLGIDLLRRRLDADSQLQTRFAELLPQFQTQAWHELAARQRAQGLPVGGHQERAGRLAIIAATYQLHLDD